MNGEDSVLHIWTKQNLDNAPGRISTITGNLDDQSKVSLIDCIFISKETRLGEEEYYHYKFFPHYATIGQRYYSNLEKSILGVSFVIDDAPTLFNDFTSFGAVHLPPELKSEIKNIKVFREIPFEENHSVIAYWTGKFSIFSADTKMGRIIACHQPSYGMGDSRGISIKNEIHIKVEFPTRISIKDLDLEIRNLLRIFGYIAGRPQNLQKLTISKSDLDDQENSTVHINRFPRFRKLSGNWELSSHSMLIDIAREPETFAQLLQRWLEKDNSWHIARSLSDLG